MFPGDLALNLIFGCIFVTVSLVALRHGALPGGFRISRRRDGYDGSALDRQDPRVGLLVVVFWLLCGVLLLARAVWLMLGAWPPGAVCGHAIVAPGVEIRELDRRPKTNGLLVLETHREVRSQPARRLGTEPWFAYLFGVRLLVDTSNDPPNRLNDSHAVVGGAVRLNGSRKLHEWRLPSREAVRFYLYVK